MIESLGYDVKAIGAQIALSNSKLRIIMRCSSVTILLFFFFPLFLVTSCQKEINEIRDNEEQNITVHFKPVVNSQDLVYGSNYVNPAGETFSVRAFKFYVSGIELIGDNPANNVASDNYYLVDFADESSAILELQSIPAQYNKISFILGVDSTRNVSGAQTGALDPANGMFWTWNSGYIMAKLEGYSPASDQPNDLFEYHIGGFRTGENVVRSVTLNLSSAQLIDTRNGQNSYVEIDVNVNNWFSGMHPVSIANFPVCMTPGALALRIADNYLTMFSVKQVMNE